GNVDDQDDLTLVLGEVHLLAVNVLHLELQDGRHFGISLGFLSGQRRSADQQDGQDEQGPACEHESSLILNYHRKRSRTSGLTTFSAGHSPWLSETIAWAAE